MTDPRVMTPKHARWREFYGLLDETVTKFGCNHIPGSRGSRPAAQMILTLMDGIDVEGSLEYFDEHGGCCCDCEILMNVEDFGKDAPGALDA
jgi:hypothetical protein